PKNGFPRSYGQTDIAIKLGPEHLGSVAAWAARCLAPALPWGTTARLLRLSEPRSAFLRWASWAALTWQPSPSTKGVRIYQIHGAADRTLPIKYVRPDVLVPGAGHLLSLTHADVVNDFIRTRVR